MPDFIAFVVEQMAGVARVRARAMFGGYGIYDGDRMFAIVVADTLYLKADVVTRPDFDARGLQPFRYEARGRGRVSLSYYEAPPEVFEERAVMRTWMNKALDAALRAPKASSAKTKVAGNRAARKQARRKVAKKAPVRKAASKSAGRKTTARKTSARNTPRKRTARATSARKSRASAKSRTRERKRS